MNPPPTHSIRVSELNRHALEPGFPKSLSSASLAEIEAAFKDPKSSATIETIRLQKTGPRKRFTPTAIEPPESTHVWGLDYHAVTMRSAIEYIEQLIQRRLPSYVVTSNLNYSMLCEKNPRLADFTRRAALVLCDGMPILWRSLLNKRRLPARVAGADLIYQLAEHCAEQGHSIYLYGAADGVAQKTADKLCKKYPKLIIAGVQCPPFHASSAAEIQASLDRIRSSNPDVLLVALGQPKGEYWIDEHLEQLGVPVSIQVGASFDFVAGIAVRAPRVWQKIGMEWLYRTLRDPKRLGPRYAKNFYYLCRSIRRELIDALS